MKGPLRVAVTGATGFIGRHVLPRLISRGHEVHAIGRGDPGPGATHHPRDLLSPESLDPLMATIAPTHLLHLAWNATPGQFWTARDNLDWIGASLRLYRAFALAGGRRAVLAGTCAEYDWGESLLDEAATPLRPATLYGASKDALRRVVEAAAGLDGISFAWGRIFFLYGPGEASSRLVPSVVSALLEGRPAPCTEGFQERDFLHVSDVAEAFASLLESDAEGTFNVASGNCVPVREIVSLIGELAGRPDLIRFGAIPTSPGEPPRLEASVRRLREEVGVRPAIPLREGLGEVVAARRAAPGGGRRGDPLSPG